MTTPPTAPILIAEDGMALALTVRHILERAEARLAPYGLAGGVQIVRSVRGLLQTLDQQAPHSVRLLLIDLSLYGGNSTVAMHIIRHPASGFTHPALHPTARIIGWSALTDAVALFQAAGLDGFVSKNLPISALPDHLVLQYQRSSWLALEK